MPSESAVLYLARRLAADAREVAAASLANNAVSASQARITELRLTVAELARVRRSLDALHNLGGMDFNYGSGIQVEFDRFEPSASVGLPSAQTINNSNRRLKQVLATALDELSSGWDQWAGSQINAIAVEKILLLSGVRRDEANREMDQLRRLRKLRPPTWGDISVFDRAIRSVREALSELPDGDEDVLELARLLASGPVSLSELTLHQVSLLHSVPEIASQVSLSWGSP